MKTNIQTKVEGAGVITQSKMVKIDGRTFRMTSTIRQVAGVSAKSSNSFAQLAKNVAKAKAKKH